MIPSFSYFPPNYYLYPPPRRYHRYKVEPARPPSHARRPTLYAGGASCPRVSMGVGVG